MNMNNENIRFYTKVRTALNIPARIIYDELCSVFGDQVPALRTVKWWSKLFQEGREDVEDEERPGSPITETTSENIEQVRSLINDNPHVTIQEMEVQTGLSHGTIHRIISDHLNLKKLTARYIPKQLTDSQKAERVRICKENLEKFESGAWRLCDVITGGDSWFYHKHIGGKSSNSAWVSRNDPSPTVVRQSPYVPKTLMSIFFKSTGPVFIHHVEGGQTINHRYYIDNCLEPLIDNIKRQRPTCGVQGIKLHYDNGRPHVHKEVTNYLESEGITIIKHPPYSPDLAPCGFWLFDFIKQNIPDQSDSQSLHQAVSDFMNSLSKEEYRKTFDKRIQRMRLCVDNRGDYFEHLME
ncbi:unnamed protein product [Rotaria sp. Silwood1]|nr:unnamed protein product [Rotaria sp. Silwood1]CAF4869031.1 unnamed protein product [Rotaria sp. Silwood1]